MTSICQEEVRLGRAATKPPLSSAKPWPVQEDHPSLKCLLPKQLPLPLCFKYLLLSNAFHLPTLTAILLVLNPMHQVSVSAKSGTRTITQGCQSNPKWVVLLLLIRIVWTKRMRMVFAKIQICTKTDSTVVLTPMPLILYWLLRDILISTIPLNAEFLFHMSDLSEVEVLSAERRRMDSLIGSRTTPDTIPGLTDFGESTPRNSGLLGVIGLGGLANLGRRSWFKNFDSQRHSPDSAVQLFYLENSRDESRDGSGYVESRYHSGQ